MMYRCILIKNVNSVIGGDSTQMQSDLDDFVNNYMASANKVDFVNIDIFKSIDWTGFKGLIDGVSVTWSDVVYTEDPRCYAIYVDITG